MAAAVTFDLLIMPPPRKLDRSGTTSEEREGGKRKPKGGDEGRGSRGEGRRQPEGGGAQSGRREGRESWWVWGIRYPGTWPLPGGMKF